MAARRPPPGTMTVYQLSGIVHVSRTLAGQFRALVQQAESSDGCPEMIDDVGHQATMLDHMATVLGRYYRLPDIGQIDVEAFMNGSDVPPPRPPMDVDLYWRSRAAGAARHDEGAPTVFYHEAHRFDDNRCAPTAAHHHEAQRFDGRHGPAANHEAQGVGNLGASSAAHNEA